MESIKWTDIVASFVVLYSAVLSTYNLIRDINNDKPRGKVRLSWGFTVGLPNPMDLCIVTFVNTGKIKIKVEECGLILPDKRRLVFLQTDLPQIIEPMNSVQEKEEISIIKDRIVSLGFKDKIKIRGYYRDATGRFYYSKSVKMELN